MEEKKKKKRKTQMSFFFLFLLFCLLFTLCNFVFNFFELNFLSYLCTCNQSTLLIYQSVSRKNVTLVHILRNTTSTHCLYKGNNRSLKKINNFFTKKLIILLFIILFIYLKISILIQKVWGNY